MGKLNCKISALIISYVLIVCNGINIFAEESLENGVFGCFTPTNEYGVE